MDTSLFQKPSTKLYRLKLFSDSKSHFSLFKAGICLGICIMNLGYTVQVWSGNNFYISVNGTYTTIFHSYLKCEYRLSSNSTGTSAHSDQQNPIEQWWNSFSYRCERRECKLFVLYSKMTPFPCVLKLRTFFFLVHQNS